MPELTRNGFMDTMAFLEGDQHHAQQLFFYGPTYAQMQKSPPETQCHTFLLTPPNAANPPEAFMQGTAIRPSLSTVECEQQMAGYPAGLQLSTHPHHNQSLHDVDDAALHLPEIDSTWIDMLDDLPPITQDFPPSPAPVNVSLEVSCAKDYSSCVLPVSLDAAVTVRLKSAVQSPKSGQPAPPSALRGPYLPKATTSDDATSTLSPVARPLKKRGPKKLDSKWANNLEQLEHVRRERQRRDEMSSRISALECLLPSTANFKRDRASIVHDSVHYVKSLQKQVEELRGIMSNLQRLQASSSRQTVAAPGNDCANIDDRSLSSRQPRIDDTDVNELETGRIGCQGKSQLVEYHVQVEGCEAASLKTCVCRADYMSTSMKVLEQLNLDLCRCSVTKMFNHTICVIAAKPRLISSQEIVAASSSTVVAELKSVLKL